MHARAFACAVVSLAAVSAAGRAAAQTADPAEAAFAKGVADLEAKRYDTACPALAESMRLDPRPGTIFTLAECEAARGRIATAVGLYEQYLARFAAMTAKQKANHRDREPVARAKRDELSRDVPELTLVLPPGAPEGVVVKRDGVAIVGRALGAAAAVDPGDHAVSVDAPSGAHRALTVTLAKREKRVIVLEVPPAAVPLPASAPVEAPAQPSALRTAAFVSVGVGAVGVLVGAIAGGLALGKQGTINAGCRATTDRAESCNQSGLDAANSAQRIEVVSDVGFGVGVAGAAAALVLFLVAPKAPKTSGRVTLAPVPGGSLRLGLEGTW